MYYNFPKIYLFNSVFTLWQKKDLKILMYQQTNTGLGCWGSHRDIYQHSRWGFAHKENMQFP